MMRVLYAVSEVYPFAKTGGLADVAGALPPALAQLGHEVKIILPKYKMISAEQWGLKQSKEFILLRGGKKLPITLWTGYLPKTDLEVLFLSTPFLSDRNGLYQENGNDYSDNLEGFSLFCRALLEVPKLLNWPPDILHVNDWQTALALAYLKSDFQDDPFYQKSGTVFTIHNLAFQGVFPGAHFSRLDLPYHFFTPETMEYYGKINFLKAGLIFSGIVTTVSPTYSREILTSEYGCGMEGILQQRRKELFGILNGADYKKWNPVNDRTLPRGYRLGALEGKEVNKKSLQRKCKFPEKDVPLIGVVSRLTPQKGIDLIIHLIEEMTALDLQMVILGIGDPDIEEKFKQARTRYGDKISVHLTFDEKFAHRVMAGSDIFLMPSRFEPCGLSQIYALRYGAVPLVRKTGGLADTIVDATPRNLLSKIANGIVFEAPTPHALLTAIRLAISLYQEKPVWHSLIHAAMSADFSWDRSAKEYIKIYHVALDKVK